MQDPNGADDVAWYNFTARPGSPGNAVFAGHSDHFGRGQAVFFALGSLKAGDEVRVRLENGVSVVYTVLSTDRYPLASAPMAKILAGGAAAETATFMTSAPPFANGTYSQMIVVVAARTGALPPP